MEPMSYEVISIAHNSGGATEIVPSEYLYNTSEEAKQKIQKYLSEYDITRFNKLREIASKFLAGNFRKEIREAVIKAFK